MNELIKYQTNNGEVELSPQIIKNYLVNGDSDKVTEQEVTLFMELCKYRKLNPFLKECHLIKYGSYPASLVVSYDVFKNRADNNPRNKGYDAGIIIEKDGELIYRQGALLLKNETLVGGWYEGERDDRNRPIRVEVTFDEYVQKKKDGTVNKQWTEKPAFMIRKVALAQGLRETYPNDLNGLYMEEENAPIVSVSSEDSDVEVIDSITKDEIMILFKIASKDVEKEKGKKILHQALVELDLRSIDTKYEDLNLLSLTKQDYKDLVEKINEIKSR